MKAAIPAPEIRPMPDLPLVSVIIVNYNYGRYLKTAIDSVMNQTYPSIECCVIDNASTDESPAIIRDAESEYPSLKILRRAANGGQSAATADGFGICNGEYVVFLDADDYLLPRCIEAHIFTHLSLRVPVGFTSCDVIQVAGNRMVTATSPYFSAAIVAENVGNAHYTRNISDAGRNIWPFTDPPINSASIRLIPPPKIDPWCWSPTSANCFRREALQIVMANPKLTALTANTDAYLIWGVASLTGSVLIDHPLVVYRLHGLNIFSKHPSLIRFRSFDEAGIEANRKVKIALIDYFIASAGILNKRLEGPPYFFEALEAIDKVWPPLSPENAGFKSYLAEQVFKNYEQLAEIIGTEAFLPWAERLGIPQMKIEPATETQPGPMPPGTLRAGGNNILQLLRRVFLSRRS